MLGAIVAGVLSVGVANGLMSWKAELRSDELAAWDSVEAKSQFGLWKREFGKAYSCDAEEAARYAIWYENLERIAETNSKAELSYKVRMNQFGDMTDEEFRDMYSCLVRDPNEPALPLRSQKEFLEVSNERDTSLPSSVDWTTKGVVTPVKNQGQCGSCWAFSATGSMECQYAIKHGTLNSLSEQQLVDCSGSYGNYGCSGGWYYNAWKYAEADGGLCSESEYPYTAHDGTCKQSSCGTKYNDPRTYTRVTADSESSLESASAQGCVSVAIEADQFAFQYYSSGVLDGGCGTSIDHAVLVVGYGTQGNQEYWKVKNSWGTSWGEQGYVLICRNCNQNGSRGECGINMYPYQVDY